MEAHTHSHRARDSHTPVEIYVASQCMKFYFKYNSKYFSILPPPPSSARHPNTPASAPCVAAPNASRAQLESLAAMLTELRCAPHLKSVAFKVRRVFVLLNSGNSTWAHTHREKVNRLSYSYSCKKYRAGNVSADTFVHITLTFRMQYSESFITSRHKSIHCSKSHNLVPPSATPHTILSQTDHKKLRIDRRASCPVCTCHKMPTTTAKLKS